MKLGVGRGGRERVGHVDRILESFWASGDRSELERSVPLSADAPARRSPVLT